MTIIKIANIPQHNIIVRAVLQSVILLNVAAPFNHTFEKTALLSRKNLGMF
jgi:hypothetical protein